MGSLAGIVRYFLVFPLLALAGCKVVMEVPAGGSVVTESGVYGCGEQQTCEIDVEDVEFDETFVAVPRDSYAFMGWKERAGGLCRQPEARTAPCPVSTGVLALAPQLLGLLDMDISVYLEPEFAVVPQTTILFPPDNSTTVEAYVQVRGTASSPDGVAWVSVNGVGAFMRPLVTDAGKVTEVSWSASVGLEPGATTISVEMTDSAGAVRSDSATVSVNYQPFPAEFTLDAEYNRVLSVVLSDSFTWDLLAFDLDTGETSTLTKTFDSGLPYQCLMPDTRELFRVSEGANNQIAIRSFDLDAGVGATVASTVLDPTEVGPDYGVQLENLTCDSGSDEVYLTYSFVSSVDFFASGSSRVTAFDVKTGESRLVTETPAPSGSRLAGSKVYGPELASWRSGFFPGSENPLEVIDRADGDVRFVGRQDAEILDVVTDKGSETFYLINRDGVTSLLDFEDEPDDLSLDTEGGSLNFAEPTSAALDKDRNRLIIADALLKTVLSVDLVSGNREALITGTAGEGVPIFFPNHLHVMDDGQTAYVLDTFFDEPYRLIEVDLGTGDRRTIGDIEGYSRDLGTGLAVDEEDGVVYSAMWDIVLATDLSTGLTEEVAGGFVGRGTIFVQASDIVLDKKNNRLLIADAEQDAVIAMDLDSRERTLLSRNGTRGFGPPLTGVSSLAIDSDNGVVYAGSPELEGLLAVDLETGQRDVALSTCTDVSGRVRPARFERMTDMILADGKILISGSTLSTFDIESGSCTQGTTPRTSLYSIGSVKGSDSLLYGISQFYDALVVLDKVSGSVVLISD